MASRGPNYFGEVYCGEFGPPAVDQAKLDPWPDDRLVKFVRIHPAEYPDPDGPAASLAYHLAWLRGRLRRLADTMAEHGEDVDVDWCRNLRAALEGKAAP